MTVGVSLGGQYTDSSSPKRNLFYAAVVGDPTTTAYSDLSALIPFEWDSSLNSGNGGKVSNSIYFFDGNTPDTLSTSLSYAIESAISASNINTASNADLPYVGASLGNQIYVGKFQPPTNGGSIWGGDLLMFNTMLSGNSLLFLDTSGNSTTTLSSSTAEWSAYSALYNNRYWYNRTLYTRLPGTSSTPEPGLSTFSDDTTALQSYVAQGTNKSSYTAGGSAQKQVIQFVMGADLTSSTNSSNGKPSANRTNIMGDIIDSSPAAIEYNYSDISSNLPAKLSAVAGDRFRLILVGTNQGWLHAFGEVTKASSVKNSAGTALRTGAVDELWSFMPTDFLSNLDQVTVSTNAHRFLVDGAPYIYHLDLPPSTGGSADGKVETTGSERCVVLFGLGKGGRSYYAIDIKNPYSPTLLWSLVPDEASYLTSDRILNCEGAPALSTVKSIVANMGYSTCTPAIGRVLVTSGSTKTVHDVVFLGGGYSVPEIESNYSSALLGRSVLALDVYTGKVIKAVDLTSLTGATDSSGYTTVGPVAKGLVPFEFIQNSGYAQRAYFTDFWGGLWSWGRQLTDTNASSSTYHYREDSSDITTWTSDGTSSGTPGLRLVAKDKSGNLVQNTTTKTAYYSDALYSTLPAPWRVSSFPGKGYGSYGTTSVDTTTPAAVGIAIESGDRNNPLDYDYTSGTTLPTNHRLSVIFDRQDSLVWGYQNSNPIVISNSTSDLLDAYPSFSSYSYGDAIVSEGNSSYFLAPSTRSDTKFGYYRKFPTRTTSSSSSSTYYISKGINTPAVVSGSLYYTYFTPTSSDVCTGGSGNSYTWEVCDVLSPIINDTRTTVYCSSGLKYSWVNIASDFTALGTRGVIQTGTLSSTDASGTTTTYLSGTSISGKSSSQYSKPRVWRTVQ
nr:PilC/PilY family type IV pilus protein [uncultured Holophaga sp.]